MTSHEEMQRQDLATRTFSGVLDLLRSSVCKEHVENLAGSVAEYTLQVADHGGFNRVRCALEGDRIEILMEMGHVTSGAKMPIVDEWRLQSTLPRGATALQPEEKEGRFVLPVLLKVNPWVPLAPLREESLRTALTDLEAHAGSLREWTATVAPAVTPLALRNFEKYAQVVQPLGSVGPELLPFARQAAGLLGAGPAALVADDQLAATVGLRAIADSLAPLGISVLSLTKPNIPPEGLLQLGKDLSAASGMLAVPAGQMVMGTNPYDSGRVGRGLLNSLSTAHLSMIFFGRRDDLEATFTPQGVAPDPLLPVMLEVPPIPLATAVAIRSEGAARALKMSSAQEAEVQKSSLAALSTLPPSEAIRVAGPAVSTIALASMGNLHNLPQEARAAVKMLSDRDEILGGLKGENPANRSPRVHQKLLEVLFDETVKEEHKELLLGQDEAINELYSRLRAQVGCKKRHQPLVVLMEGPPATGKSASVDFLAEKLRMVPLYVDGGAMSTFHQAQSMLLGSGRGIVNSYVPGKLELACRNYLGTAVEVADLDHAPDEVRSSVGDMHLQLLDKGIVQSATGTDLSGANLLICFTCNLPADEDQKSRSSMGFWPEGVTRDEVKDRITKRMSTLFSAAFLSRVGEPVVFRPLDEETRRAIVSGLIPAKLASIADTLDLRLGKAAFEPGVVDYIMDLEAGRPQLFGARRLATLVSEILSEAVIPYLMAERLEPDTVVDLAVDANNNKLEVTRR